MRDPPRPEGRTTGVAVMQRLRGHDHDGRVQCLRGTGPEGEMASGTIVLETKTLSLLPSKGRRYRSLWLRSWHIGKPCRLVRRDGQYSNPAEAVRAHRPNRCTSGGIRQDQPQQGRGPAGTRVLRRGQDRAHSGNAGSRPATQRLLSPRQVQPVSAEYSILRNHPGIAGAPAGAAIREPVPIAQMEGRGAASRRQSWAAAGRSGAGVRVLSRCAATGDRDQPTGGSAPLCRVDAGLFRRVLSSRAPGRPVHRRLAMGGHRLT